MGASVKPVPATTDDQGTPQIGRALSPDEFEQARGMSTKTLGANPFPAAPPPFAPRDVTRTPNDPNPKGQQMTGLGRILTQYVAQPIMDHPLTTAATTLVPGGGLVMGGLMAKDVAEYAAQKFHEVQTGVEAPNRIPGERAAVEAAMLGVAPLVHAALKGKGEVSDGLPEGAAAAEGVAPRAPAAGETPDLALQAAGTERLSGLPISSETRGVIKAHVDAVTDSWNKIFDPASRSPEALQAQNILRATTGEAAAQYEQAAFKLDEFRRAIEPLPESDKLGFIDAIEGGKSQPSPEFQPAADAIRKTLDNARESVQALGTGKLEHFIEDYFPHIWTDPDRAAEVFAKEPAEQAKIDAGGKRPMEGGKSFLKQRTIPTTMEGVQAGLEPVSYNPVDLTLLKLREIQRYVMAHQSLTEMKEANLVRFVRSGDAPPDGYARINDKIATVFGPRQGAVVLPKGANIEPSEVTVPGTRIMGEHWAPEPVARVVNNYLSPGLRGNAIYDAYRGLGNTLNQAQLGLSAFHLGFTSMDASVSRAALALEHLASGEPIKAVKAAVSVPVAPVTNALLGKKIRAAYLDPESASPEMQALANAVKEAGGRVRQDSFYQNSAPEKMAKAWREGEYGKATALSLPALFEWSSGWLMNHVVPMQKLGVFGDMAKKVLADLPDDAPLAARREALAKAWDSVDNRMGQVVYDNLGWNKVFKDLSMASVRSVGWNLGTIRELGGGLGDIASAGKDVLSGKAKDAALTHRAAYVMTLPIVAGMYGATYQLLRTGQWPQELKDYFYPKTGEQDADGNDERVQLASYMKDMFAYAGSPWGTVKHKMSPLLTMTYEMLQNENFFGDEIRNPNDPVVKQVQQEASYIAKNSLPFSVTNMMEQSSRGDQSTATRVGNWFGVTPAPRRKVRSDAQNMMSDFLKSAPAGSTPEEAENRKARADLLSGLRGVTPLDQQKVNDSLEKGDLTPKELVRLMKEAGMTPAQEKFKRLTLPQAVQVFKAGSPREQALFADALVSKVQRYAKAAGGAP